MPIQAHCWENEAGVEADEFLKNALDPVRWLEKSVELRRSGDALWDAFFEAALVWAKRTQEEPPADESAWHDVYGLLTSGKFLYGLAVESALKAHILRDAPGFVQLKMSGDGTGRVTEVEFKQFGMGMGSGHNLERLAERAGVFDRRSDPLYHADSDYRAIREILRHLTEVVYWSGRYPVPVRSGETFLIPPDVPPQAFGHYMRDWLDTLLDRYQGNKPQQLEEVFRRMEKIVRRVQAGAESGNEWQE